MISDKWVKQCKSQEYVKLVSIKSQDEFAVTQFTDFVISDKWVKKMQLSRICKARVH